MKKIENARMIAIFVSVVFVLGLQEIIMKKLPLRKKILLIPFMFNDTEYKETTLKIYQD